MMCRIALMLFVASLLHCVVFVHFSALSPLSRSTLLTRRDKLVQRVIDRPLSSLILVVHSIWQCKPC